jgi:hypothetical protein
MLVTPSAVYKGDPARAWWFFDKETALAAAAFEGDRKPREKQMLTFIQDDTLLPVARQGFAALRFEPDTDGLSFRLRGAFLSEMPAELIGAGGRLGHAPGPVQMRVITGAAMQTGPATFRVQFDRQGPGGDVWIQEEHPGNAQYRHAVQPGKLSIPARLTEGKPQQINFPAIGDQRADAKGVLLKAIADSGLPIDYYVVAGPAIVEGSMLRFTPIPVKSRYPVIVTVVAYQWGRTIAPLYQSAEPVTQTFFIKK